ncbi:MAG: GNAT family protein [Planctomycetota bacterium]
MKATGRKPLFLGERVHLRYPEPSDVSEFVALRRASRMEQEPWEATLPPPDRGLEPWGPEAFERFLEHSNTLMSQRHLICRNDDGLLVGQVSLTTIVRSAFRSCFMGYWMGTPYTGKGYMTEAVVLCTRRAFGPLPAGLGLHRIEINIVHGNARSVGVARRSGFRLEGFSPNYLHINGNWADHERWAATADSWEPPSP